MGKPSQTGAELVHYLQSSLPEPKSSSDAWKQMLPVADLPDALLFWVLHRRLPALIPRPRLVVFNCFKD